MRTNKTLRIASVLLIAVLLTTCVIGTTLAKYTSTINTAVASAQVAKWDITYTAAGTGDDAGKIQFNLFETINDTVPESGTASAETDVASGKIAPGTSGSFKLSITNSSEVNAQCKVTFDTSSLNGVPLKFSIDNGQTWTDGITSDTSYEALVMNATREITVMWKWEFDASGNSDTDLGEADTPATASVSAQFIIEQVD